ncbi:hypothetical protein ARMGADRAFT_669299 [Armillaria gallica]|uniref:Protein kinase domain-containing protein n=1 Tax=Armillaria gallica TaxID=47427 RepID=A0A2H3D7F4_ARMGA|nr:hypothetical protein ARMGADRAFT_669299 [Armillaria gallica]
MVQSTVKGHGESSALRFRDVCAELEVYLTDLTFELNSTRRNSRGIKRFLKAKNVSDAITGYRERVRTIKEDFLIHTAVDSRLVISDIKAELKTSTEALTSAIEASQQHTISNTHKNTDRICEEIRTWGVLQSQKADLLSADVQTLKERGSDKVRDVRRWEIYVKKHLASSYLFKCSNRLAWFDTYSAEVDNSNAPKIVRVYCSHRESNKLDDVIQQFHIDIDRLTNLKHPHIAQIYGVCRSPDFLAIIFHGTKQVSVRSHCAWLATDACGSV